MQLITGRLLQLFWPNWWINQNILIYDVVFLIESKYSPTMQY